VGGVGRNRDLSNSSGILRGNLNLSGIHIFLQVLQSFHHLRDDSRLARSRHWTHRKFSGTWDRDNVLSLSQNPRKGDLTSSRVVFLADLLQTRRKFEDVGEVLLRIPRDVSTEVAVLKVVGGFLWKVQ